MIPKADGASFDRLRRRAICRVSLYGHDGASRLTSLAHDPSGAGDDQSWSFEHNPAGQIVSQTAALSGWGWAMGSDYSEAYTANGLNQHLTVAGASVSHDARGNMTDDGLGRSFAYDAANRLTAVSGAGAAALAYDPAGRLREVAGTATTRFLYDGADAIAEYDETDALLRRYVHGPGLDEPLIWYEGTGTGDRRFLLSDPRGSVVAVTDGSGAVTDVNKYDDYGAPASGNIGRFQFTGQMWLEEAGLYHYKARAYHPALGRFMQTDPIGYGDGMNMYAYVGNDPVNRRDPSGMVSSDDPNETPPPAPVCPGGYADCITVEGKRRNGDWWDPFIRLDRGQFFADLRANNLFNASAGYNGGGNVSGGGSNERGDTQPANPRDTQANCRGSLQTTGVVIGTVVGAFVGGVGGAAGGAVVGAVGGAIIGYHVGSSLTPYAGPNPASVQRTGGIIAGVAGGAAGFAVGTAAGAYGGASAGAVVGGAIGGGAGYFLGDALADRFCPATS